MHNDQDDELGRLSREEQILMRTQDVPYNRRQRRAIAKQARVSFKTVNPGMARRRPAYFGIKEFKKTNPELAGVYKDNAWKSARELSERRRREAAEASAESAGAAEEGDHNSSEQPDDQSDR